MTIYEVSTNFLGSVAISSLQAYYDLLTMANIDNLLTLSLGEVKSRQESSRPKSALRRRYQAKCQAHPAYSANYERVMPEVEVHGPLLWLIMYRDTGARESADSFLEKSPVAVTALRGAESSCLATHCVLDNEGVCLSAEVRDRMNGLRPRKIQ